MEYASGSGEKHVPETEQFQEELNNDRFSQSELENELTGMEAERVATIGRIQDLLAVPVVKQSVETVRQFQALHQELLRLNFSIDQMRRNIEALLSKQITDVARHVREGEAFQKSFGEDAGTAHER